MTMAYEYEKNVVAEIKELGARYKAPSFYAMADEVREVYAKAKAFDEIVPFVRKQFVRANQSYGFAKLYMKSNEELKQAEEELLKIHQVAITASNVLGITTEKFIMMEDK